MLSLTLTWTTVLGTNPPLDTTLVTECHHAAEYHPPSLSTSQYHFVHLVPQLSSCVFNLKYSFCHVLPLLIEITQLKCCFVNGAITHRLRFCIKLHIIETASNTARAQTALHQVDSLHHQLMEPCLCLVALIWKLECSVLRPYSD